MPQREYLDMIKYLAHHAIYCDLICDWLSQLITFNNMLNYISTQLFSFSWIDLISFSLDWINQVQLLITYSFRLFWLRYSSLQLPCGRWWKTLPITSRKIWLVRPIPHAKYRRTIYPFIPGDFNYSEQVWSSS